jgi:hypothetical protein
MKSLIVNENSIEDFILELDKIYKDNKPTLAFVFASSEFDIRKLVAELNRFDILVVGATTAGEVFANEELGVNSKEGTIVGLFLDINKDALNLRFLQIEDEFFEAGSKIGKWAKESFESNDSAIITTVSGLTFDNEGFINGILSEEIEYIFGGVAGDDLKLKETFVFTNENFTSSGVVALAIDRSKIDIVGARAFGWGGISRDKIVTKAKDNIVYTIDNKPAVEFYHEYLSVTNDDMPQTGIEYPLEVHLENGNIVYRAVLAINEEDGSLVFAGHVPERSRVKISAPAGESIIDEVGKSIDNTLKTHQGFKPEVGLLFPCCSRKQVLGNFAIKEIEMAYNNVKVPLVGFYAYGEIGAFPGGDAFHNETFVTTLLANKKI